MKQAVAAMYQSQKERDEALEKLHKKTVELYEVKTQLEKEKAENTARPGNWSAGR